MPEMRNGAGGEIATNTESQTVYLFTQTYSCTLTGASRPSLPLGENGKSSS